MAALQCEICGGKLVAKAGGVFECEFCGMQYDKTRIQEMVREMQAGAKTESAPAAPMCIERPAEPARAETPEEPKNNAGAENRALYAELRAKYARARDMLGSGTGLFISAAEGLIGGFGKVYHEDEEEWRTVTAVAEGASMLVCICADGSVLIEYDRNEQHTVNRVNTAPAPKAVQVLVRRKENAVEQDRVIIVREDGSAICVDSLGRELHMSRYMKEKADLAGIVVSEFKMTPVYNCLKKDGTVATTWDFSVEEPLGPTDVVELVRDHISVGGGVGLFFLTGDGRVVADQSTKEYMESKGEPDPIRRIEAWTDIIQITYCKTLLIGLKTDGTVVTEDMGLHTKCLHMSAQFSGVRDAIAVRGSLVLTRDGFVQEASEYNDPPAKIKDLVFDNSGERIRLFGDLDAIDEERETAARQRAERRQKREILLKEKAKLTGERASLGLFAG